jgi:ABC-type transport system substrate-binding protein
VQPAILLAAGLFAITVGCVRPLPLPATDDSLPPAGPVVAASPSPTPGPTGRALIAADPPTNRSANPGTASSVLGMQYHWPVFDGLVWIDREARIQPGLAAEWRTADARTWDITLGDWRFHDGSPVTPGDVIGTLDYYRDPLNRLPAALNLTGLDRAEITGERSVRLVLRQPDPTFLKQLGLVMILPMDQVRNDSEFFRRPIGSGPFQYAAADFNGRLTYRPVLDHATPRGTPGIREVDVRFIPEQAAKVAALRSGEVDIITPIAADAANALRNDGFLVATGAGVSTVSFLLDPFTWPTRDVRVRQAMNHAVDRDRILKAIFGGHGELDSQLFGRELPGYNPGVRPYVFDPNRARDLLIEAGYTAGLSLPMTVNQTLPAGRELGEAVAADLARVGVNVVITARDTATWTNESVGPSTLRPGLWVQTLAWDTTFEPNAIYRWFSSDITYANGRRWDDPQFDRLYQQARVAVDDGRRAELYQQAARYFHDQAPVLFLWRVGRPAAFNRSTSWEPGLTADNWVTRLRKAGP